MEFRANTVPLTGEMNEQSAGPDYDVCPTTQQETRTVVWPLHTQSINKFVPSETHTAQALEHAQSLNKFNGDEESFEDLLNDLNADLTDITIPDTDSEGYSYEMPPLRWVNTSDFIDPTFFVKWDNEIIETTRRAVEASQNYVAMPCIDQQTTDDATPAQSEITKQKILEAITGHALPINLIVNMAIRVHESKTFVEKVSAVFGLCEALNHYQPDAVKAVIQFLESLFSFDVQQQTATESLVGFILIVLAFMGLNVKGVQSLQWINDEISALGSTARGFNSIAQTITTHSTTIGSIVLNALGLSQPTPVSKIVEDYVKRLDEHSQLVEEFLSHLTNDTSVILTRPWEIDSLIANSDSILKEAILLATHKEYTALGPNIPRLQAAHKMLKATRDRVLNASATRVEPVVIQLYGEPGVGKSFFVKNIVNELSKALHIPPEIYARGLTKHWDSFVGQYFIVYDDFLSDLQGEDMKELIHIVSSNPFVVPMANVEQKGLRFSSPFIILCSNQRDAPLNNGQISNPDAIDRRRHFLLEVKRKPTHQKLTTYQSGADHLELIRLNPLYREGVNRPGQRDTRIPISFNELINSVIEKYRQHLAIFEKRRSDELAIRSNYLRLPEKIEQQSEREVVTPRAIVSAEAKTIAIFGAPGIGKSTFTRSIEEGVNFRENPQPSFDKVLLIDDPRTPEEISYLDKAVRDHFDAPVWKNVVLVANPEHLVSQLKEFYAADDALSAFKRRLQVYAMKKTGLWNKTLTIIERDTKNKISSADLIEKICDQPAKVLVTYVIPRDLNPGKLNAQILRFHVTWKTLWACSSLTDLYSALGVSCFQLTSYVPLLRRIVGTISNDGDGDRQMSPTSWAKWFNTHLIREEVQPTRLIFTDVEFLFYNYKDERDSLKPLLLVVANEHQEEECSAIQEVSEQVVSTYQKMKESVLRLPQVFGIDTDLLAKYATYIAAAAGSLLALGALGNYVFRRGYETAVQEAAFTSSDGINTKFTAKRRMILSDDELDYLEAAMQLPQNKGKTIREILDCFQERATAGYDHYERKIFAPLCESSRQLRKKKPWQSIHTCQTPKDMYTQCESQEPVRKNIARTHLESQEPTRKNVPRMHLESQEPVRKNMPRTLLESQEPVRKNAPRTYLESQEPTRVNKPRVHFDCKFETYCSNNPVVCEKERAILATGEEFKTQVDKCTCKRCGSSHCARTCKACEPESEACIDVGGLDVAKLVSRSIVNLFRPSGHRINNGVMLAGHVGVTTAHGILDSDAIDVVHFDKQYKATIIHRNVRRDLAYFRLEKTAPPFRSLIHLLPETVQVDRQIGALLLVPQHDREHMMMNYPVLVSALTTYCKDGKEIEARSYNKSISQAAFEHQFTVSGDCGSPIIAIDTCETKKFLGIHSASSAVRAYMSYLSKRDVQRVMELPEFEAAANVLRYQMIEPLPEPEKWGNHMEIVGTAIKTPSPDKTKLWITPYAGFHEIQYQPAILNDRDPRKQIDKSVLDCLLTKWDHEPIEIPKPEYMERAVHALYNHYAKIFVKKNIKLTTLTASEALNSWKGNPMSNPIYLASSAGYPWACLKYPGVQASGKFGFVEFDQNTQRYRFADNPAGRAMVDSIATLNGVLKAGTPVEIPFQLHLKDECLKENKIAAVGTRSICASPLDFLVVDRQYLHAAHAAISSTSDYGPCMVGINPSSLDWHTLAMRMLQKGPIGFDGDYSAFDSRVPAKMFDYLYQFYEMLYEEFDENYKLEHSTVRRGIFRCLQNPLLVARGNVYRSLRGGQPSGQPATSVDNSLINTLYFLYAWQVIHENHPGMQSPERFFDHCALAVYGDDNICTMTDIARETFTPHAVQNVLNNDLGQKVSDAAKTGLMKWTALEDMEFLKRTFNRIGAHYTGALVPQSFEKILSHANYKAHQYTTADVCTTPAILQQLVDTALREASLHGEEFYNKLRRYIIKINAQHHLEPPTRESWFSMFNSVYYSAKVPSRVELGEEESEPGNLDC